MGTPSPPSSGGPGWLEQTLKILGVMLPFLVTLYDRHKRRRGERRTRRSDKRPVAPSPTPESRLEDDRRPARDVRLP